jgi:hypothetical protein
MNTDLTYDGRIPANMREHMEPQLDLNDLGIAFSKLAEALMIEMNQPCKRRYTHAELADSFRAIRQVNAERLGPTKS